MAQLETMPVQQQPPAKRKLYIFESCEKHEAVGEIISTERRYWVRSPHGAIQLYFANGPLPDKYEFVRPVGEVD